MTTPEITVTVDSPEPILNPVITPVIEVQLPENKEKENVILADILARVSEVEKTISNFKLSIASLSESVLQLSLKNIEDEIVEEIEEEIEDSENQVIEKEKILDIEDENETIDEVVEIRAARKSRYI